MHFISAPPPCPSVRCGENTCDVQGKKPVKKVETGNEDSVRFYYKFYFRNLNDSFSILSCQSTFQLGDAATLTLDTGRRGQRTHHAMALNDVEKCWETGQ